jgi:hypothetical protein
MPKYVYEKLRSLQILMHSIKKTEIQAAVGWATVQTPVKMPEFLLRTSGSLRIKANHVGLLKAIGNPSAFKEAKLKSWPRDKESALTVTKLMPGMHLILPNVCFEPDPVEFQLLMFPLSTTNDAETASGRG